MRSAAVKGRGFIGRLVRLLVLALIALVHNAFFSGDILIITLRLPSDPLPQRGHEIPGDGSAAV